MFISIHAYAYKAHARHTCILHSRVGRAKGTPQSTAKIYTYTPIRMQYTCF